MSTGLRFAWGGAVLLLMIAGTMLVREVRQTERAAAALNLATARKEEARQRLKLAEQKLARAEREKDANPAGAPAAAGASTATSSAEGTAQLSMPDGKLRPEIVEATDPELRALSLQMFDAYFDGVWGPLLQQLNLSEEKAAALKALLRAHEERRMDVTAVAGEQQLKLSDPAIQKMRRADGARLSQEVLALLGPDDGKIYREFRSNMAVMAQIKGLAEATYHTSTPLTYAESLQLRSILAANSEREANGFVRPSAINWEAALAQIAGSAVFSATTVEAFRQQVADAQTHRQISQRLNEIGSKVMGPGQSELWVPRLPALQPRP
jgi:hypothetical protein